jgi:hypothetical protein
MTRALTQSGWWQPGIKYNSRSASHNMKQHQRACLHEVSIQYWHYLHRGMGVPHTASTGSVFGSTSAPAMVGSSTLMASKARAAAILCVEWCIVGHVNVFH